MFWENNRFMDWLTKFSHMIVLSALWVICSLPVITIGPATIALYYAAAKTIRCGIGYPTAEFFRCMKENFRQGVLVSIGNLFAFLFCYGIYQFAMSLGLTNSFGKLYYILFWLVGAAVIFTDYYLISVISRFQLSFRSAVQMAVYFSVRNLKTEIPMLFTLVGAIVVISIFSPSLFFLPAAYAFLMTFSTEKALGGYIREHMKNSGLETMWFMEL